jgi:hypothetical protein
LITRFGLQRDYSLGSVLQTCKEVGYGQRLQRAAHYQRKEAERRKLEERYDI